jgi:hypothetical protein
MDALTLLKDVRDLVNFPVIGQLFMQYCMQNQLTKAQVLFEFCQEECDNVINDDLVLHMIWSDAFHTLPWLLEIRSEYRRWFTRQPDFIDALDAAAHEGLQVGLWWEQELHRSNKIRQHNGER